MSANHKDKGAPDEADLSKLNKVMPCAQEAEEWVLGYVLSVVNDQDTANDRVVELRLRLHDPAVFYVPGHRLIWETCLALADDAKPISVPSVALVLREQDKLEQAGGLSLLSSLATAGCPRSMLTYFVDQVREKWLLRQLIIRSSRNIQAAQDMGSSGQTEDLSGILGAASQSMFELLEAQQGDVLSPDKQIWTSEQLANEFVHQLTDVLENTGKIRGLITGIADIDRITGGFCAEGDGDMWLVPAWPGSGKSVLGVTIAESMSLLQQIPGMIFPLEMGRKAYSFRLVPGRAQVNCNIMRNHTRVERGALDRIGNAAREMKQSKALWDPSSSIEIAELEAKVRVAHKKHGIKYILIDHLGQIKPSTARGKSDERLGEIEVMERLHAIRRELNILVIVLVQLNKNAAGKPKSALPTLSDVKGAAEKTEYPTVVSFIIRPPVERPWHKLSVDEWNRWEGLTKRYRDALPHRWASAHDLPSGVSVAEQDYREHAYLCFRKNRNGPTPDQVPLRFLGEWQRFTARTDEVLANHPDKRQVELPGF